MNKEAKREYDRLWYLRNKEKVKEAANRRYQTNKEAVLAYQKQYYELKKDEICERVKRYNNSHPEVHRAADKRYRSRNEEKERNRNRNRYDIEKGRTWRNKNRDHFNEYFRERYMKNVQHAICVRLRTRLRRMLKIQSGTKFAPMLDLIGCSLPELLRHLEQNFLPGMSWENRKLWHVDHIRPCASFELTDPEQQRQCFHWSNLQPLWATDNIRKGKRYEDID